MIVCQNLKFQYPEDSFSLEISRLEIAQSEKVAIIGPSGCGKTTLLKLISGILRPASGEVIVDGNAVHAFSKKESHAFRVRTIGLVPQRFELLDYLTTWENILLPFRSNQVLSRKKVSEKFAVDSFR